jgi:hypothetical protein
VEEIMELLFVGFLMLFPAITVFLITAGGIIIFSKWGFSHLRAILPGGHPVTASILHVSDRRTGIDRRHGEPGHEMAHAA